MAKSIEERLRIIEIKDAAAMCMYRYWRCLDYKLFDGGCRTFQPRTPWRGELGHALLV